MKSEEDAGHCFIAWYGRFHNAEYKERVSEWAKYTGEMERRGIKLSALTFDEFHAIIWAGNK
jgi:hypothetical protein